MPVRAYIPGHATLLSSTQLIPLVNPRTPAHNGLVGQEAACVNWRAWVLARENLAEGVAARHQRRGLLNSGTLATAEAPVIGSACSRGGSNAVSFPDQAQPMAHE